VFLLTFSQVLWPWKPRDIFVLAMRRRGSERRRRPESNVSLQSYHFLQLVVLVLCIVLRRDDYCFALSPSASRTRTRTSGSFRHGVSHDVPLASSPLFASQSRRTQFEKRTVTTTRNQQATTSSSKSSTALHMVLTTPESIIEQASTVTLLDDLVDESVRTSARKPIMMQFDPSSGWVRTSLNVKVCVSREWSRTKTLGRFFCRFGEDGREQYSRRRGGHV
jgi:hypothetical protein